ncbi:MAG: hypothetical protein JWL64_2208 [Frankiales bacterium]|nr:hypothetical protein [Frankiales bacterium]
MSPDSRSASAGTGPALTVAVDGTAASQAALLWSLHHALRTHGSVTALASAGDVADVKAVRNSTRDQVSSALTALPVSMPYGRLAFRVVLGDPRTTLLTASAGSDLLVLGSPSAVAPSGGDGDLVRHCTARSVCGVVVVPAPSSGTAPVDHAAEGTGGPADTDP